MGNEEKSRMVTLVAAVIAALAAISGSVMARSSASKQVESAAGIASSTNALNKAIADQKYRLDALQQVLLERQTAANELTVSMEAAKWVLELSKTSDEKARKQLLDAYNGAKFDNRIQEFLGIVQGHRTATGEGKEDATKLVDVARVRQKVLELLWASPDDKAADWTKTQLVKLATTDTSKDSIVEELIGKMTPPRCAFNLWALRVLGNFNWCAPPNRLAAIDTAIASCGKDTEPLVSARANADRRADKECKRD